MKVFFKDTSRGVFYQVFKYGKLMEEGLTPSREFKIARLVSDYRVSRAQIKEVNENV